MKLLKRILLTGLTLCLLTAAGTAAETVPETQPPYLEAVYPVEILPGSWSPLSAQTPEKQMILELTSDRLYRLSSEGAGIIPSLAAGMPVDVTTEYAGTYGVPRNALRGYAFCVELSELGCWEDGRAITATDWHFTLCTMMQQGALSLNVANKEAYLRGLPQETGEIISLEAAGLDSVSQAMERGYTQFYVDTDRFWGLDAGWQSVADRTRILDEAIPSGGDERYVSGGYLYQKYLSDAGIQSHLQKEFVGIRTEFSDPMTLESVGILCPDTHKLVLILSQPVTPGYLAMELEKILPLRQDLYGPDYATSCETYSAVGPYRVVLVSNSEIRLERNPHFRGTWPFFEADAIRLLTKPDIGT